MAVGSVALSTLVQMVRAVIRHYVAITFSGQEIENALNASQGKIFAALPSGVKRALYGGYGDITPGSSAGVYTVDFDDLAGDDRIWDVVAVREYDSSTLVTSPMFKADLDFVLAVSNNDYRQGVYWARHGDLLFMSEDPDDKVRVFYIRRPVDMTDSLAMDLPDEYRRYLVLMTALDLLSYNPGVPNDSVASARQEVVVEAKSLGLYPDLRDGLALRDAEAPGKNEEPLARGGGE